MYAIGTIIVYEFECNTLSGLKMAVKLKYKNCITKVSRSQNRKNQCLPPFMNKYCLTALPRKLDKVQQNYFSS